MLGLCLFNKQGELNMDKCQRFIFENTACQLSTTRDPDPKSKKTYAASFIDGDKFLIRQAENYNIKKYFLLFSGITVQSITLDGAACEVIQTPKHTVLDDVTIVVPIDFDSKAEQIDIHFANEMADSLTLHLSYVESDHAIYDAKVQDELNKKISPDHKTGTDLVNIYWVKVSDKVVAIRVNLYVILQDKERLIAEYEETKSLFKSITGLAFGDYSYEIIELGKGGEEIARTPRIKFKIKEVSYGNGRPVNIIGN